MEQKDISTDASNIKHKYNNHKATKKNTYMENKGLKHWQICG